jgi:hypothetical protein
MSGNLILLLSRRTNEDAEAFKNTLELPFDEFGSCAITACSIAARRHNIIPRSRAPKQVHDAPQRLS